ncbi:3-oxoacyl-[Datura stramonium]|uniref:beta-ketoacyl-[acyl-carrier-protein] synthase I n=1 Tax=Datura stramonium TaxID=4076 RepID=A0ABS8S9M0_DATST|nr:3-oxoacyl-[acyl-carrier-protein] synthase I, chloroplastic [Datura stramonium]
MPNNIYRNVVDSSYGRGISKVSLQSEVATVCWNQAATGFLGLGKDLIDKERAGVLVGTGMGGLTVFFRQRPEALIEKGHRKITPFFIPYAITNMGSALLAIDLGGFVACRALSQRNDDPQTASRPWDKDRDGFVMGEGAGVLVMESLEHAMKLRGAPIIAEYLGGAVNCDAYHMTDPRADGLGVSSCILSSLEDAGNCHQKRLIIMLMQLPH